jgi:hypothetical protein
MNNAQIMQSIRSAGITKAESIRICQDTAAELERRMARDAANPYSRQRSYAAEEGASYKLAQQAFCHSIVHAGK